MIASTRKLKVLLGCCLAIFAISFLHYNSHIKLQPIPWPKSLQRITYSCPTNAFNISQFSSSHKLAPQIIFHRRHIRTIPSEKSRQSITKSDEILLPPESATIIDTTRRALKVIDIHGSTCLPPITLPITDSPPAGDADLSSFVFGVSTTLPRLYDSIPHFTKWLTKPYLYENTEIRTSNGAQLFVLLHKTTGAENAEAEVTLRNAGISAIVRSADEDMTMPERYFSLIPSIYSEIMQTNKITSLSWMVLIDDDTFFMRPSALSHALHSSHPTAATKPLFIGAETEIVANRHQEGSILLGGAGIFVSIPLARELLSQKGKEKTSFWEKCMVEDKDLGGGDARVSRCITRHTSTPMTPLPGLHQMSIFGDTSGFYESGQDMLSIHHWKSWHWFDPVKSSLAGDVCGEDCVLQRFQFAAAIIPVSSSKIKSSAYATNPMILTNGFSISEYGMGIDFDTGKAENTFDAYMGHQVKDMDYGVGELRDRVQGESKLQWRLLDAMVGEEGVVQWYGWKDSKDNLRKIAELTWLK